MPSKIDAHNRARQPSGRDFLSFKDIEDEYPNTVKSETLFVWKCAKRYGFDKICRKIGRNVRVRREDWERFLDSRTGWEGKA
jgi:hypothetical protein